MNDGESTTLEGGLQKLVATRAEHKRILQTILADGGMALGTRQALIEHLLQEEDEQLARLTGLTGGGGSPVAGVADASAPALTVGSLRPEGTFEGARLGSLRGAI
jgi:hypothetical protein